MYAQCTDLTTTTVRTSVVVVVHSTAAVVVIRLPPQARQAGPDGIQVALRPHPYPYRIG
jgi:hypothetical protein